MGFLPCFFRMESQVSLLSDNDAKDPLVLHFSIDDRV